MKLKSLIIGLSLMLCASAQASSVCILTQTSSGMFLACDGVDDSASLVNATSPNYTDLTLNLDNLLNQGYKIVGQTDQQTEGGSEKLIFTLVK